jgi:hypothetical protein
MIDGEDDDDRQLGYNFSSMLNPVERNRRKDIKCAEVGEFPV